MTWKRGMGAKGWGHHRGNDGEAGVGSTWLSCCPKAGQCLAAPGPTIPLVMTSLGAWGLLGKRPSGCPLYMTRVCSSVICDK